MKKPGKAYYMISAVAQKYNIHPQTLALVRARRASEAVAHGREHAALL